MPKYVVQRFTGGMNEDIDPVALDLLSQDQVVLDTINICVNMVFERGLIKTRQAMLPTVANVFTPAGNPFHVESLPLTGATAGVTANALAAVVDVAGTKRLWALNTNGVSANLLNATEITGAGLGATWINPTYTVVNGAVIISNHPTGLIRWDPTTAVYTFIAANPKYAFVTHQFSRAIAAYQLNVTPLTDPLTIAYSGTSETDWTSISSGKVVLPDVGDSISGLLVIKGVVIVARTYGFHIGVPTGLFPNLYNWQLYSENSIGCGFPTSFRAYKNVCFFVSNCGVHTFDAVNVTDIGEGIYKELFFWIQRGYTPRGFISQTYDQDYQPTYNLMLDNFSSGNLPLTNAEVSIPHFQYNMRENKWSRHTYVSATGPGSTFSPFVFPANFINSLSTTCPTTTIGSVARWSAPIVPVFKLFNGGVPGTTVTLEDTISPSSQLVNFKTAQWCIAPGMVEAQLNRILLVFNSQNTAAVSATNEVKIQVSVASILNGVKITSPTTIITTSTTAGVWERVWVNIRQPGNLFQISVTFTPVTGYTAISAVAMKEMIVEFDNIADERI